MSSVVQNKTKKHHKLTKDQVRILVAFATFIQAVGGIQGLAKAFNINRLTIYKNMEGQR